MTAKVLKFERKIEVRRLRYGWEYFFVAGMAVLFMTTLFAATWGLTKNGG